MSATTHTFRVEGMHCGSCALLIDDALEDLPGVGSTQTTLKQGRTTVDLDLSQNSPQDVVKVIEELGYQASPLP
ncbi:heavy metal-associated domain-containing protein [Pseudofrankia sp. BMG5.37]|uniref:heavy-metal-associated domain-containing protein n=1 Tax=Pseudofrankia sp. BMG5.37 TaxID=3050035 RepID=UPI002895B362|nr:heavy metal-associated domain-containing protein [Pseudofrankia sp. BMG5.37]MDT3446921.1 heavy metal-associated domain-containing protein [Pseudofrankia sp. BMG5.37]